MRIGRRPRHAAPKAGTPRHLHAARRRRGQPWRSRTSVAVGLMLALVGSLTLSVRALAPSPATLQASPTASLGAWVAGGSSAPADQLAAIHTLEATIGRKLAIGHSFVPWGKGLGSLPTANIAEGRTPLISFGDGGDPIGVARGAYDTYLRSLARAVRALGQPVLLRYNWTMDASTRRIRLRSGFAFVAAWRHVHDLFAAQGVRGSWVWSPDAAVFAGAWGGVSRYWPGDGYVDWIGADGFNAGTCEGGSGWTDFATIFKAFYSWGSARTKPLIISETGTVEDPADPGRKQAWYLDAVRTLAQSMPRIRAVVYFDQGGRCDWRPETSARSLDGFVRFARDPFFGGSGATQPGPSTTTSTSTTVAPTTTTRAPTTTAPSPTTSPGTSPCAANGGVPIGTGDNAQSVVNAHGAGTTYLVKAGTHLRNFSVQPKSGDTFCGEPGAVLEGGRSLQFAFSGRATNVTLDSITMQNYNTGRQRGAVQPDTHASGWTVRNVSALHNYWAGLMAADGMKVIGGHYNDNDQMGIGGNAATGVVVDGAEMARNHLLHESCEFEGGGFKWDVGQVTVRNSHVHDNQCRGLWADINAHDALVENNLIEDNQAEGILYEISQDAVMRNNRIYRNGLDGRNWYWGGGITVASSFNVEVYGNRLSGNYNGLTGTQQTRTEFSPPAHLLSDYNVHDNLICATVGEHATGVISDNGTSFATRSITFTRNTIQSATCQ